MLNSLLERPSKKVKVDRVMKTIEEQEVLLTKDKEELGEVRSHFAKQFWKRNIELGKLSSRWAKAYSPIKRINEEIYSNLLDKVTETEWKSALSKTKNKSVPGVVGISYPLIKKAEITTQRLFRLLADQCIAK